MNDDKLCADRYRRLLAERYIACPSYEEKPEPVFMVAPKHTSDAEVGAWIDAQIAAARVHDHEPPQAVVHEFKQPGWDHVMGAFIEGAS